VDGDTAKGSGRSIKGFSLMDALSASGSLLLEYGGHELAAGLSIDVAKIEEFRIAINNYAAPLLGESETAFPLEIECETAFSELSEAAIDEILRLEPFGLSNPQPVLMLRNCVLKDVVPLSQGRHVRFRVCGTENGRSYSFNAVYFGIPFDSFPYSDGDVCDVAFTADMNEYMGMRTPQLFIKAVRVNEAETEEMAVCNKHFRMRSI
jgi:single-stranded-DNA-specific exonuclease